MSGPVLAASDIEIGAHPHLSFLGMTFNVDTVVSTGVAALIVIGLGFFLRAKVTAGVPGGVQLFWEAVTEFVRENVEARLNRRPARFVIPLAITLFTFILIANWISVLPSGRPEHLPPPTADTNLTYAMALLVIVGVHVSGFREKGAKRYLGHFLQPLPILLPITLVEEIAKPFSLALRLFGNIFAGTVMLAVIALFPPYLLWAPNVAWKLFDLFIGAIQAFIFALLTIIYFGQAAGEEEGH